MQISDQLRKSLFITSLAIITLSVFLLVMSHVSGTIFIVRFFVISNRMFEYIRMQYIGRLRPLEISILFAASATGLSPFTHQVRDVSV